MQEAAPLEVGLRGVDPREVGLQEVEQDDLAVEEVVLQEVTLQESPLNEAAAEEVLLDGEALESRQDTTCRGYQGPIAHTRIIVLNDEASMAGEKTSSHFC